MSCHPLIRLVVPSLLGICCMGAGQEVPPKAEVACFPGAYYRKAVSSQDVWNGIEGVVTLPQVTFDEARRRPKNPEQFLDNPSVYMGGRGGETEIDAGVTWEVIKEPDGSTSKGRKAFRPFWRNKKWFAGPAEVGYYFWPGDTIRIRIVSEAKDKLTMEIELVARGEAGKKEAARFGEEGKKGVKPLVVEFDAPGWGPGRVQEFKRVNAIDQVGNEGKAVQPTKTKVVGALWHRCELIRGEERRAFVPERFTDMRCPARRFFTVTSHAPAQGGEAIDIDGGR